MAPPTLPRIDSTELVLVAAESVLYGIFLVLLVRSVDILLERRRRGLQNVLLLLSTALSLFLTITTHWVLDISRAFDAFIYAQTAAQNGGYEGFIPGGPSPATAFLADITTPKYLALAAVYLVTTDIGDVFMIYRLYIVWDRNPWILIFPVLLELSMNATGCMVIFLFSQAHESIFASAGGWITAFFVLTFLANVFSTGLIAFKVWRSNRAFGSVVGSGTAKIFQILVQSASLYSLFLIVTLGAYIANSNIQFVVVAMNNPVIGIIFTMIISRMGNGSSYHSHSITHEGTRGIRSQEPPYALRPMAINITTEIETPRDEPTSYDDKLIGDRKLGYDVEVGRAS